MHNPFSKTILKHSRERSLKTKTNAETEVVEAKVFNPVSVYVEYTRRVEKNSFSERDLIRHRTN